MTQTAVEDSSSDTAADRGRQLDRAAFAALAGYKRPGTVTSLLARGRARRQQLRDTAAAAGVEVDADQLLTTFPEPDGQLGRTPFWYEDTVQRWMRVRLQRGMSPVPEGSDAEAEAGPGTCPICDKPCPGSVASHRQRRDACSYDPAIREAAHRDTDWVQEKAAQAGPGTCPICGEHFDGSVAAHRMQKRACSFDPAIRDASR